MAPRLRAGRTAVVVAATLTALLVASCDAAVARSRGTITSVRQVDEQTTEVCLRDTQDAGSTYGSKRARDSLSLSGVLRGIEPTIGSCVVLQIQGESSVLEVGRADDCE